MTEQRSATPPPPSASAPDSKSPVTEKPSAQSSVPTHDTDGRVGRNLLRQVIQDPQKGVFLFHQRSRRRIFLHRFGLKRLQPLPEAPVLRMDTDAFLEIIAEEEPELSREIAGKTLPPQVFLIEMLTQRQLKRAKPLHVWWRYWSWRTIGELMGAWERLQLGAEALRQTIGHTAFEEARYFFLRERFLIDPEDEEEAATTLVAWWAGMGVFAPKWRDDLFPSIPAKKLDLWLEEKALPIEEVVENSRPPISDTIPRRLPREEDPAVRLLQQANAKTLDTSLSNQDRAEIALHEAVRALHEAPADADPIESTTKPLTRKEAFPAWSRPIWLPYLDDTTLQHAAERCERDARHHLAQSEQQSQTLRKRSVALEFTRLFLSTVLWWLSTRFWGRLIGSLPFAFRSPAEHEAAALPTPDGQRGSFFHRLAARLALRDHVFEFTHAFHWSLIEEWRGNDAEAALQCAQALRYFRLLDTNESSHAFYQELLARHHRLQKSLTESFCARYPLDEKETHRLRELVALLVSVPLDSRMGRLAAAILKAMQRAYLDRERLFYVTRLMRFLRSLGKAPLQESLEHYGLMRSLHYLQLAHRRMETLPIREDLLHRWTHPLQSALRQIEDEIRQIFGTHLIEAMESVGLSAKNLREEVAQARIRDDIMDLVIRRGRLSFSDLRDVISRNEMRLHDTPWKDALSPTGDTLLRLDQALQERFHDIYRAGEIYLRLNQRFAALAFGTPTGRWICRFLLIPFGGAAVLLVTLAIIIDSFNKYVLDLIVFSFKYAPLFELREHVPLWVMDATINTLKHEKIHLLSPSSILGLGFVLLLIIHTETGWDLFRRLLNGIGTGLRFLIFEAPRWLYRQPIVQWVVTHPRAFFLYRKIFLPLFIAILLTMAGSLLQGIIQKILHSGVMRQSIGFRWWYLLSIILWAGVLYLLLNTPTGRAIWDWLAYRILALWQQIREHLVVGLVRWTLEVFRRFLIALDYVLYRVDDLLRFHEGERKAVIWIKISLQSVWFTLTYFIRLLVNLVAEPQLNPIKHFPVVTVAHKMLIPATVIVIDSMKTAGFSQFLLWVVGLIFQFGLPGLCGFLVWEFKENWKLFRANQSPVPSPVRIGSHGETIDGLLRRGFHSGTLPRIYEKLYKKYQKSFLYYDAERIHRLHHDLHHVADDVKRFVERELIATLHREPSLQKSELRFTCGKIHTARKHLDIHLHLHRDNKESYHWCLRFELEGGWLLAEINERLRPQEEASLLNLEEQRAIDAHFSVFLQKSGVRLVRSKLEQWLAYYERDVVIGKPGEVTAPASAVYWLEEDRVRLKKSIHGAQIPDLYYELTPEGYLRKPAPNLSLDTNDPILPRPQIA